MPNKKKKPADEDEGKALKDISVDHLALVDRGANRRRFAMMKQAEMDELTGLIQAFFEGDEAGARFVVAKAAAAELTPEDGAAIAAALKVLVKYVGDMPTEMTEAMQTLLGAAPALEPGAGEVVSKVAKSGGLDFVLQNLMLGSGNRRMVESVLKCSLARDLEDGDEDLEEDKGPVRGVSKAAPGQEESILEESETENRWPSL